MVPGRSLRGECRLEELTIQRKRKAILTRAVNGDWTRSGELENSKWLRRWGTEGGDEVGGLAHSL